MDPPSDAIASGNDASAAPPLGVSLAALRAFAATHRSAACDANGDAGGAAFDALSTADVAASLIAPCATASQKSFVALAQEAKDETGKPQVAPATVYVIHAWAAPFSELLDALAASEGAADAYFYIDAFVCEAGAPPPEPSAAVAAPGRALLVLHPWEAPLSLSRALCVWELLAALDAQAKLDVALSPAQRDALRNALPARYDAAAAALTAVDASTAAAATPAASSAISAAIAARAGGVDAANAAIRARLRTWLAGEASAALGALPAPSAERTALLASLAPALRDAGQLSAAEVIYRELLDIQRNTLGAESAKALATATNLASVCMNDGKVDEAEPLYRTVLAAREKDPKLGPSHARTNTARLNLAHALKNQGRLAEAAPLYEQVAKAAGEHTAEGAAAAAKALQCRTGVKAPTAAAPVTQQQQQQQREQQQQEQAPEEEAVTPLAGTEAEDAPAPSSAAAPAPKAASPATPAAAAKADADVMPAAAFPDSPCKDTNDRESEAEVDAGDMVALTAQANALMGTGHAQEAEALYRRVLRARKRALGDAHADTLAATNNLGASLRAQGGAAAALPLLRKALAVGTEAHGPDAVVVAATSGALANCLADVGQLGEAETLHRAALRGRTAALGEMHADTLASLANLALCIDANGQVDTALALAREALQKRSDTLGPRAPDTLASVTCVAGMLLRKGAAEEAVPLYRTVVAAAVEAHGEAKLPAAAAQRSLAAALAALPPAQQPAGRHEAEVIYRSVIDTRADLLGRQHPDTAAAISDLALLLIAAGRSEDLNEAELLCREALRSRMVALGEAHPATRLSQAALMKLMAIKRQQPRASSRLQCCFAAS